MEDRDIVLLDGGVGQEIYRRAGQPAHPLWSTKVMMDTPEVVRKVHEDFIESGARIITVNSYPCTPTRLQRDGQPEWFETLQHQALRIAHEAREAGGEAAQDVQIAGCLPPLIGSYTQDPRSLEALREEYQRIAELQAPEVDLFLIETISVLREAQAATEAVQTTGKPVLLSFTLSDTDASTLRSGESLSDALEAMRGYGLSGLLFNCSFPETISKGLAVARGLDIPTGGYANGFTSVEPLKPGGTVDALTTRRDLNEARISQYALEWIQAGARVVGGCCEVGPSYIAHLHARLRSEGYRVVGFS